MTSHTGQTVYERIYCCDRCIGRWNKTATRSFLINTISWPWTNVLHQACIAGLVNTCRHTLGAMVAEINRGPKFLYAPYTQISIDFCAKSCFWYKLTTGVWEQLTKKQLLRPKLSGVRARTATRSGLGPQPYLSLQPLKLATLNLV